MPRTPASFRRSPERCLLRARGFTLLELLVVLSLMSLVAGLVAPGVSRAVTAARERSLKSDLRVVLEGLPVRAYAQGRSMTLDGPALQRLLEMPDGFAVQTDEPLRYGPTGIASGGVVRLLGAQGASTIWRVEAVSGALQTATAVERP